MPASRIRIFLNLLVSIVNRKDQITLSDAAKLFDIDENYLLCFVKILVDAGVLKIEYPTDGSRIVKKGDAAKDIISQKLLKEKVDAILDAARIEEIEEKIKAKQAIAPQTQTT